MPFSWLKRANGEGDGGSSEDSLSEVEEAGEVPDSADGFPLSVDLSAYWGMPAACLVWARRARRVSWLAARLRRAAALRRRFLLAAGARALPPAEPLHILARAEPLRVLPVEHEWQRPFSFPPASPPSSPLASPAPPAPPAPSSPEVTSKEKKKRRWEDTVDAPLAAAAPAPAPAPAPASAPAPAPAPAPEPERDDSLRRVKQRALALLERVRCREDAGGERGDEGSAEGAGSAGAAEWEPPAKRRRRRVLRRRARAEPAAPPDPTLGFAEGDSKIMETSPEPEESFSCEPNEREESPEPVKSDVDSAPAASPPAPPAAPPAPAPLPLGPPLAPVVRNAAAPRAPRLVRALSGEILHKPMEEPPAAPLASLQLTTCR